MLHLCMRFFKASFLHAWHSNVKYKTIKGIKGQGEENT